MVTTNTEDFRARLITVCDACLRACCWNGLFHCDDYQTAGTVEKTIAELDALGAEHRDYYMDEEALRAENEELRRQLAEAQSKALEYGKAMLGYQAGREQALADNAALVEALVSVTRLVGSPESRGYSWIPDGEWGSYEYEDQTVETLRQEVGACFQTIRQVISNAIRNREGR